MAGLILRDLSGAVLRSNLEYRFKPFESFSPAAMYELGQRASTTAFAGVLTDAGTDGRSIKAVSADTAALFEHLRTPRSASTVLTELPSHERDNILGRLVLDGILMIAVEGAFVTQCPAYHLVIQNDEDIAGAGRLAALSIGALKHGQRLSIDDPEKLAARLYFYHRLPVTSSWRTLWPDAATVLEFLGAAPGGALRKDLFSHFDMPLPRASSPLASVQWLSWHRRESEPNDLSERHACKLYISPDPQYIRLAFAEVAALLPNSAASSLKIGPTAYGLLRPDKFVVYFNHHDDLLTFAEVLLPRLTRFSAHGVPFTASIDDAGILSWGVDPPAAERGIGWYVDDSWRIWICNRLALALIAAANSSEMDVTPWRYALAKLWLSGVDTRTWTLHATSGVGPGHPSGAHT